MLPPGRAKLATIPFSIGFDSTGKTIGTTVVACFAARTAALPCVTMTSTLSRKNSAMTCRLRHTQGRQPGPERQPMRDIQMNVGAAASAHTMNVARRQRPNTHRGSPARTRSTSAAREALPQKGLCFGSRASVRSSSALAVISFDASLRHNVDRRLAHREFKVNFRVRRQEAFPDRRDDCRPRHMDRIDLGNPFRLLSASVEVIPE